MSGEIRRWADEAMWEGEPTPTHPAVTLLSLTHNPIRVMAAASETYVGHTVRDVSNVSREDAEHWFKENQNTRLQAPFEFVDLHFLIEGVTRAFTHQLRTQRTAVFVQESMRFAVKTREAYSVALPPSLEALPYDHPWRVNWDLAVQHVGNTYRNLIDSGMPAEDARGLLPTNITTRVHYKTNLRNLAEHAGLRLCSQAQQEWKLVWYEIIRAIKSYQFEAPASFKNANQWQLDLIAGLFKPICYTTGRCEFRGEADRYCSIRERVEKHYARGERPEQWVDIDPREPLIEGAARRIK